MLSYSQLKNFCNAPIGTIMPWSGDQNTNRFPPGWILCNGDSVSARDYPQLGKVYGFSGDQTFSLPSFDNDEIKDLGSDTPGVPGSLVGSGVNIDTNYFFNISVSFSVDAKYGMIGNVNELEVSDISRNEIISVVPRILGVDHTPSHLHKGDGGDPIPSVEASIGRYAPVFVAPTTFSTRGDVVARRAPGSSNPEANRRANPGTLPVTWYVGPGSPPEIDSVQDYTLYSMGENSDRTFSGTFVPNRTSYRVPAHGSTLEHISRIDRKNRMNLETGILPKKGSYNNKRNHYEGSDVSSSRRSQQYSVPLNHNNDIFSSPKLRGHSHGIYNFSLETGSLRLANRLFINNIRNASTVRVKGEDEFAQLSIDTTSPGMLCFMIIKAY